MNNSSTQIQLSASENNAGTPKLGIVSPATYPTNQTSNSYVRFSCYATKFELSTKKERRQDSCSINHCNYRSWIYCFATPVVCLENLCCVKMLSSRTDNRVGTRRIAFTHSHADRRTWLRCVPVQSCNNKYNQSKTFIEKFSSDTRQILEEMKNVLKFLKPISLVHFAKRYRHTARLPCKVCVVGANGVIGRHLATYMKMNSGVVNLTLYDTEEIEGLREDISHIDYNPWVFAHSGDKELHNAVSCSEFVIVVCGCRKQEDVDDHKLFEANAPIVMKIMEAIMETNQKQPFIHIITEPVNTLVPLAALALQKYEQYDERKLSGSTSIDLMRARLMYAEFLHVDPYKVQLPVIGGRSEKTIIPLLSVRQPSENMTKEERDKFLKRLRTADMDVMNAKCGEASAQLSVAVAASRFCYSVVEAILRKSVKDVAFIPCKEIREDVDYFSTRFLLEENGVKEIYPLPNIDGEEEALLEIAIKEIEAACKMAKDYYAKHGKGEVKKEDCQEEKDSKKGGKEEKKTGKEEKKEQKKEKKTGKKK
uniref:Malate dehydrogenase, mitochondrial n=1 Tax=Glossina palpalis gambiensis TaxID=67801 RepID=A0A1B0C1V3_9MUSC